MISELENKVWSTKSCSKSSKLDFWTGILALNRTIVHRELLNLKVKHMFKLNYDYATP